MSKEFIPAYQKSINVPDDSIKRGFDIFSGSGYTNIVNPYDTVGGKNGWPICDHPRTPIYKIFTVDGETKKGLHRELWCRDWFGAKDCGDCDFGGDGSSDARMDYVVKGVKVPIGQKVQLVKGHAGTNSTQGSTTCNWTQGDWIGYSYGDFDKIQPKRLPEEVATGCSGGTNKKPNEFVTTTGDYKIQNSWKTPEKTNQCWVGVDSVKDPGKVVCTKADVDWHVFCQLGDNIVNNPECVRKCKGCVSGNCNFYTVGQDSSGCEYALERYCTKKKGYPIKRDPYTGQIIYSNTDKIRDTFCTDFCGTAESSKCKNVKNELCSKPSEWLTIQWLPDYCKAWWRNNKDELVMNDVAKKDLIDKNSEQHIFSGKGLGKLCLGDGLDVDKNWCRDRKLDFCTKNDEQMLTKECWKFCSEPENAGLCDTYLDGNKGGLCGRLGAKTQEDLKKILPGTDRQISDWCGCMMPTQFYQNVGEEKIKAFQDYGYAVNGNIDYSPECSFPLCKIGSVKTNAQQERLSNSECTDCVQLMLNNVTSQSMINTNFAANQEMTCSRIENLNPEEPEPIPPGVYDLNGIKIKVYSDNSYCEYNNEEDFKKDNPEVSNIEKITEIPSSNTLRTTKGCFIAELSEQEEKGKDLNITDINQETDLIGIIIGAIVGFILFGLFIFGAVKLSKQNNP